MAGALIGTTLAGKYLVKRAIGAGGMGAVYEAEHVDIGKRVAIKLVRSIIAQATVAIAPMRCAAKAGRSRRSLRTTTTEPRRAERAIDPIASSSIAMLDAASPSAC